MLNDHEGHSRVRGEMIEEALESVESASGGSDTNDVEPGFCFARRHCSSGQGDERPCAVADGLRRGPPPAIPIAAISITEIRRGPWAQMMVKYVVRGPWPAFGHFAAYLPLPRDIIRDVASRHRVGTSPRAVCCKKRLAPLPRCNTPASHHWDSRATAASVGAPVGGQSQPPDAMRPSTW